MHSNVERSEVQLNMERPIWLKDSNEPLRKRGLQGASPYTINADLKYEFKNSKNLATTFSLVYNVSGSKIYATGGSGTDNYYEKPFHQLDFIFQDQITSKWNIKFAVKICLIRSIELCWEIKIMHRSIWKDQTRLLLIITEELTSI